MRRCLAALLPIALAACNPGFRPQFLVDDLRILAIRAEVVSPAPGPTRADPDVGDTVRLTALVANPAGRSPLGFTWYACLPDGTERLPPCLDPRWLRDGADLGAAPGVVVLGTGAGRSIAELHLRDVQGAAEALVARAAAEPQLACRLWVELPVVLAVEAGGVRSLAVKRVRISPQKAVAGTPLAHGYAPNQNPRLDSVRLDPVELHACTGGRPAILTCADPALCEARGLRCDAEGGCGVPLPEGPRVLCAQLTAGAMEVYDRCLADGTRTPLVEDVSYQWYATGGAFEDAGPYGNATGRYVRFTPPDGPFTIWTIVRDGRGGESWAVREVR